ncbi:MAG: hypothetical protein IH806_12805 [Proteobacteria bacterium]|nr:hypothetical protein [Pseudomonadota bacterium]
MNWSSREVVYQSNVSRCLPAFLLGQGPCNVIACSHTQTLADEMSTDVRDIIASDVYPFGIKTFGKTNAWRTTNGGKYSCAGIGGPVTGKGADLFIIDDPVKDRLEASSPTFRERVWEWYTSVFYTRRMGPNSAIVLIIALLFLRNLIFEFFA